MRWEEEEQQHENGGQSHVDEAAAEDSWDEHVAATDYDAAVGVAEVEAVDIAFAGMKDSAAAAADAVATAWCRTRSCLRYTKSPKKSTPDDQQTDAPLFLCIFCVCSFDSIWPRSSLHLICLNFIPPSLVCVSNSMFQIGCGPASQP